MTPAAIVLTGGRSRRMGTDKASLVVDGTPMAQRIVQVLAEAGVVDVALAGSAAVPDRVAGYEGPLAGIVAGWRYLQDQIAHEPDPIVVLSCDLPRLDASVVSALLSAAPASRHGAVAHDGERPQPLIAAYRPAALVDLAAAFEVGERSVRRCFAEWDLSTVIFPAEQLADADTPADLAQHDVIWPPP